MEALIALGSNLGDRESTLISAIQAIAKEIGPIIAQSSFLETLPEFPSGSTAEPQGLFLNAVLACESELPARSILNLLLEIETRNARTRSASQRYQARTLDLDLIALGQLVINEPGLVLPHPLMHERRFVLEPLCEIRPLWVHPVLGKSAKELLGHLRVL